MSTNNIVAEARMMCCASCGMSELDDANLKECPACESVRYCSDKCKEEHLPKHEAMCKEWAAELRDAILFRQPESSHLGDCPICLIPLSIYLRKSSKYSCCSKVICNGCAYTFKVRHLEESLVAICPFCRHPLPATDEEADRNKMKRIEKHDPVALREMGKTLHRKGDYNCAFEYLTKAAGLGDASAHFQLSCIHMEGIGVDRDDKKGIYHLTEAAISGHIDARYNLACYEGINGRIERAVKHWIIAATLGHDGSIQMLKQCYIDGDVSKEDYAAALRAHQAAVDATRSPQREAAKEAKYHG